MEMLGPWTRIELTRPAWLAALLVLPLVVYYARHSLTGFAAWRQTASLACRVLLLIVLVLALCAADQILCHWVQNLTGHATASLIFLMGSLTSAFCWPLFAPGAPRDRSLANWRSSP